MKTGEYGKTPDEAQRLLEALYGQRAELGDIANELIVLLQAAGVSIPGAASKPPGDSPPD
jgi:hypothetical protein